MKLIKEVVPLVNNYPRRYLLLSEVSDEDAKILSLCNMIHTDEFDKKIKGELCEAWMTY